VLLTTTNTLPTLARPVSLIVNITRGGIIDEKALYDVLKASRIGGAALDVFAIAADTREAADRWASPRSKTSSAFSTASRSVTTSSSSFIFPKHFFWNSASPNFTMSQ
jgi:hypothetical protein